MCSFKKTYFAILLPTVSEVLSHGRTPVNVIGKANSTCQITAEKTEHLKMKSNMSSELADSKDREGGVQNRNRQPIGKIRKTSESSQVL